jgi:trk system potassium uptake protein TrkH
MRQSALAPALMKRVEQRMLGLTPPQALFLSFVALSFAGTLLLKLPFASHQPTTWLQAGFTAVSAATVTGLAVLDAGAHFTLFGQGVLMVLMQFGGLGLMTFGVFIIQFTSGRMALSHHAALREALGQSGQNDMRRTLRWLIGFTLAAELLGTTLLALHWVPEMGWRRGLYYSLFHAISAFNNAGIALWPDSLMRYVDNAWLKSVVSLLFIAGGIGFAVVADLFGKKRFRDYSLHTKLMLVGTLVINLTAMLALLLLEYGNPATLGALPGFGAKLWAAWFQGAVPRSAGFNSIDIAGLMPASTLLILLLMFIGGGTGSTASGIKLTTFIVLLLATRSFLRQEERPVVFGRSLDPGTILKALAITVISLLCAMSGAFLLLITERAPFLDILFEAVSAFGTVGLSRGLTAELSAMGQGIVMVLMLVGRVGPLTLAFTLAHRQKPSMQYPTGQVNIG